MLVHINIQKILLRGAVCVCLALLVATSATGQDADSSAPAPVKVKPVKNIFESQWIIDNQTVLVPIKGTFEMDFQHRFGVVKNGYKDFFGLFASSNIRLGATYVPINKLQVGIGLDKYKMIWDGNVKYSILNQMTAGDWKGWASVTYFGSMAVDTRSADNFLHFSDRLTYFHQVIIARKITEKFSAEVAPSLSHTNVVNGYYSDTGKVSPERHHNHFAIAINGRYLIKEGMAIIANYDQPITKHVTGNPHPNISVGMEVTTSAHAFQFFIGNYYFLSPQQNNMYNQNDYTKGEFLIGFNITRLWNY